jgi:ABC-type multidrug transport system fused ATPase/permease subunit
VRNSRASGSPLTTVLPIWKALTRRRRRQLYALFAMSVLSAGAEVANLGALLPFLKVLADPSQQVATLGRWGAPLAGFDRLDLLLILGGGFLLVIVLSSLLRVATIVTQLRLTALIGADIGRLVLGSILERPYRWHLDNNSSQSLGVLTKDISNVVDTIQGYLSIGINGLLVSLLIAALLSIAPVVMALIGLTLGLWYFVVFHFTKAGLHADGEMLTTNYQRSIQTAQEALGGIRDILLSRSQRFFLGQFDAQNRSCRLAYGRINIRAQAPRYLIEGFTLGIIVIVSLVLSWRGEEVEHQLPLLGTLALGAYRVLQPLQMCFGCISSIRSQQVSCQRVMAYLPPAPRDTPVLQRTHSTGNGQRQCLERWPQPNEVAKSPAALVRLVDVSFRYGPSDPWVLQGVNLSIHSGQRVALVGGTGGGKSTLIDLILGLLEPVKGQVLINGINLHDEPQNLEVWQKLIAHVPQQIHLSDGSFAENIAFGVATEAIDQERLEAAAQQACIAELIHDQKDGYSTVVGEKGIRLSGGQRQRLGLARALYRDADVLVLDEATSALDNLTEHQVMRSIESMARTRTLILIAHRLSTVRHCDVIHLVQGGRIRASGSFTDLERHSDVFQDLLRHNVS